MVANASAQLRAQAARLKAVGEMGLRRQMIRSGSQGSEQGLEQGLGQGLEQELAAAGG